MEIVKTLLRSILEKFPQADPESEFYDEPIDGGEAVDFISELIPEIRRVLNTLSMEKKSD